MDTQLDWSAYDSYGAGDAYAAVPVAGGAYGKAAAVCIGNRQCQRTEQGVMCRSFPATHDVVHSTQHRAATLRAASGRQNSRCCRRYGRPSRTLLANGTSCRHQIRDGARRTSVHFARVLPTALAV